MTIHSSRTKSKAHQRKQKKTHLSVPGIDVKHSPPQEIRQAKEKLLALFEGEAQTFLVNAEITESCLAELCFWEKKCNKLNDPSSLDFFLSFYGKKNEPKIKRLLEVSLRERKEISSERVSKAVSDCCESLAKIKKCLLIAERLGSSLEPWRKSLNRNCEEIDSLFSNFKNRGDRSAEFLVAISSLRNGMSKSLEESLSELKTALRGEVLEIERRLRCDESEDNIRNSEKYSSVFRAANLLSEGDPTSSILCIKQLGFGKTQSLLRDLLKNEISDDTRIIISSFESFFKEMLLLYQQYQKVSCRLSEESFIEAFIVLGKEILSRKLETIKETPLGSKFWEKALASKVVMLASEDEFFEYTSAVKDYCQYQEDLLFPRIKKIEYLRAITPLEIREQRDMELERLEQLYLKCGKAWTRKVLESERSLVQGFSEVPGLQPHSGILAGTIVRGGFRFGFFQFKYRCSELSADLVDYGVIFEDEKPFMHQVYKELRNYGAANLYGAHSEEIAFLSDSHKKWSTDFRRKIEPFFAVCRSLWDLCNNGVNNDPDLEDDVAASILINNLRSTCQYLLAEKNDSQDFTRALLGREEPGKVLNYCTRKMPSFGSDRSDVSVVMGMRAFFFNIRYLCGSILAIDSFNKQNGNCIQFEGGDVVKNLKIKSAQIVSVSEKLPDPPKKSSEVNDYKKHPACQELLEISEDLLSVLEECLPFIESLEGSND